jgi:hypothetical protein
MQGPPPGSVPAQQPPAQVALVQAFTQDLLRRSQVSPA